MVNGWLMVTIGTCDELNQLGSRDATEKCKTLSIGSFKHKNLKLKKKEGRKKVR